MDLKEKLNEIVERIREHNLNAREEPLISSDIIYRKFFSDICDSDEALQHHLQLLKEAHYLFIINIVEADEKANISGIEGYVVAEIPALVKLREFYQRELERAYSAQFYERKTAVLLMKELISKVKLFNNTPLGNALNICVMLHQFEHFVSTTFQEFTDTWKQKELEKTQGTVALKESPSKETLMEEAADEGLDEQDDTQQRRAIDTNAGAEIEKMDRSGNWGKAVDSFGVEFLLRIHFRKYEFDKVQQLIQKKKIAKEKDLRYVRRYLA